MTSRKSLLAKIKALLSKTVENGCTEAEAIAAMEKARAMMDEHELTDADMAFGGEQVRTDAKREYDRDRVRISLAPAIGEFCNCKVWHGGTTDELIFCGLESDTVFAHWLLDTLAAFVRRELVNFLSRTRTPHSPSVRRVESNGFVEGCAARIARRLRDLAPKPAFGNGRSLVVARNALIDAHMKSLGIKVKAGRSGRRRPADHNAIRAGLAAGDAAQFNRPLNQGAGVRQIGAS